jgi:hypothetical protein
MQGEQLLSGRGAGAEAVGHDRVDHLKAQSIARRASSIALLVLDRSSTIRHVHLSQLRHGRENRAALSTPSPLGVLSGNDIALYRLLRPPPFFDHPQSRRCSMVSTMFTKLR